MEYWLYGFRREIYEYGQKEIFAYLTVFALLLYLSGKGMEGDAIKNKYCRMVRYGRYSFWWRKTCQRAVVRDIVFVGMAFVWYALCHRQEIQPLLCVYAIILWTLGLVTMNLFLLLFLGSDSGMKCSFPAIMALEILSVYGIYFGGAVSCYMPGSYLMLERSSVLQGGGFPFMWVVCLQVFLDVCIYRYGYHIYRGRTI